MSSRSSDGWLDASTSVSKFEGSTSTLHSATTDDYKPQYTNDHMLAYDSSQLEEKLLQKPYSTMVTMPMKYESFGETSSPGGGGGRRGSSVDDDDGDDGTGRGRGGSSTDANITDYVASSRRSRVSSKRVAYSIVALVFVTALTTVIFFVVPRSVTVIQTPFEVNAITFVPSNRSVLVKFVDQFLVKNPNYATIKISSVTIDIQVIQGTGTAPQPGIPVVTTTLPVSYEFPARSSNGDFSLSSTLASQLTASEYAFVRDAYNSQCNETQSVVIGAQGSVAYKVLSTHSRASFELYLSHAGCANTSSSSALV